LWSLQALPHEPHGRRPRLPGDRDGPQPGRRGGGALRQRAALADGPACAPVGGAPLDPPEAPAAARACPAAPRTPPRPSKPLYRLSERETAAYAFLRGIDYIVDECPFAKGATSIAHKQILDRLAEASPGAKHNFLFGFLAKERGLFEGAG